MSSQTTIEDFALEFLTIYKRYKDMASAARKRKHGEEGKNISRRRAVAKGRLDNYPC